MASIPDDYADLLDGKTFACFGTLSPSGAPHITPVWIDRDGDDLLVNTAAGRQKDRNVQRDARVGVCIVDHDDPYRYLSIEGEVVERTTEGAVEHIDELARQYMDVEEYPNRDESSERIVLRIRPETVLTSG